MAPGAARTSRSRPWSDPMAACVQSRCPSPRRPSPNRPGARPWRRPAGACSGSRPVARCRLQGRTGPPTRSQSGQRCRPDRRCRPPGPCRHPGRPHRTRLANAASQLPDASPAQAWGLVTSSETAQPARSQPTGSWPGARYLAAASMEQPRRRPPPARSSRGRCTRGTAFVRVSPWLFRSCRVLGTPERSTRLVRGSPSAPATHPVNRSLHPQPEERGTVLRCCARATGLTPPSQACCG